MGLWTTDQANKLTHAVDTGLSVRAAALKLGIPLSRAYAIAHALGLPLRRKTPLSTETCAKVIALYTANTPPMDIVRELGLDPSTVYRIGIQHGFRKAPSMPRRHVATTWRCEYLMLRVNAMPRRDAAAAVGMSPRTAFNVDRGLIRTGRQTIPFEPDGPDVGLYNRLMNALEYVDGRHAIPVQVLPLSMVEKTISQRYLSAHDWEVIADLLRENLSIREIARRMGRSASTISREIRRGRDEFGLYRPHHAHRKSVVQRLRPKQRKIDANPELKAAVWEMLGEKYSPEQIAHRLRLEHSDDDTWHVCHETIYQMLYFQARGQLKKRGQTSPTARACASHHAWAAEN